MNTLTRDLKISCHPLREPIIKSEQCIRNNAIKAQSLSRAVSSGVMNARFLYFASTDEGHSQLLLFESFCFLENIVLPRINANYQVKLSR